MRFFLRITQVRKHGPVSVGAVPSWNPLQQPTGRGLLSGITMSIIRSRDEVGRRYGRLTVISRVSDEGKKNRRRWLCKCDCETLIVIRQIHLRNGNTRSCGCFQRERNRERTFSHGECYPRTKEYNTWCGMKSRCFNPKHEYYKNYGGRGITVCPQWLGSYPAFLADVGRAPSPKHTLGRIDNDGNYEPGNTRWETRAQQSNNRRNNRLVTVGNETRTITEWALDSGMTHELIYLRLKRGWSPIDAVFRPVRSRVA